MFHGQYMGAGIGKTRIIHHNDLIEYISLSWIIRLCFFVKSILKTLEELNNCLTFFLATLYSLLLFIKFLMCLAYYWCIILLICINFTMHKSEEIKRTDHHQLSSNCEYDVTEYNFMNWRKHVVKQLKYWTYRHTYVSGLEYTGASSLELLFYDS